MAEAQLPAPATIAVQVCHAAAPERIVLVDVQVAAGTTVQEAIRRSGLLDQADAPDLASCRVGIWNKLKTLETVLKDRDRVEIYRPLVADPMDARRRRAAKSR